MKDLANVKTFDDLEKYFEENEELTDTCEEEDESSDDEDDKPLVLDYKIDDLEDADNGDEIDEEGKLENDSDEEEELDIDELPRLNRLEKATLRMMDKPKAPDGRIDKYSDESD